MIIGGFGFFFLVINPGSVTTEIGYFENSREIWRKEIDHTQKPLSSNLSEQEESRFNIIKPLISSIEKIDAVVGRGGPLKPLEGGVYKISETMLDDYRSCKYSNHASNLGAILAHRFAIEKNLPSFIVDPVTTDEMVDKARVSGVPGIERKSRSHALNIKHCVRKSVKKLQVDLAKSRFVVAHLGSGISVASVVGGKILDVNDALFGMGPFSIERAGAMPISGLMELVFDKQLSRQEIADLLSHKSGFMGYLNTKDLREVEDQLPNDEETRLIYKAMIYQIAKEIGSQYTALQGDVDALILTGALVKSEQFKDNLLQYLKFIEKYFVFPGSFELEALARGAMRVLSETETAKDYV
ncbi:MAG: butyrate kinase [Candidatus Marinimicrobia bacterium]|nr:butyrate kinase [Candidatus Neomarinimicrobiota bacterium]MBL7023090.1 butyrate kinase [Candidatus Neomarinimicrobiota bacterium]MBL7109110.1 butyrate kinase [Candidatus Neomarinimicrobiota bacterium]